MINKVGLAKCIELFALNERCTELLIIQLTGFEGL